MVVVLPGMGAAGETVPASVKIRDVSPAGFQALVVVPPGPTTNRSSMTVAYMAALEGSHTLPDGSRLEAGKVSTSARQVGTSCKLAEASPAWDVVNFATTFAAPPAVVTMLQTANNEYGAVPTFFSEPWLTVACQAVSSTSVSIALESAETSQVGSFTAAEEVGYVAMSVGQGSFMAGMQDVQYSATLTGAVVKGFDDGETTVTLPMAFASSPLVVGSQVSRNGNNGGWLRLSATSASAVNLFIDEDKYCDTERIHIGEAASLIAWSGPLVLGVPTTTTTTTVTLNGMATLEVGEVTVQTGGWVSHSFSMPFAEVPVVVLAPSAQVDEPAAIRIKDLSWLHLHSQTKYKFS